MNCKACSMHRNFFKNIKKCVRTTFLSRSLFKNFYVKCYRNNIIIHHAYWRGRKMGTWQWGCREVKDRNYSHKYQFWSMLPIEVFFKVLHVIALESTYFWLARCALFSDMCTAVTLQPHQYSKLMFTGDRLLVSGVTRRWLLLLLLGWCANRPQRATARGPERPSGVPKAPGSLCGVIIVSKWGLYQHALAVLQLCNFVRFVKKSCWIIIWYKGRSL